MNKQRPELIISFAGVTGHARRTLSENVQRNLFRAGYFWSANEHLTEQRPDCLEALNLHVCTPFWNPAHITYCDGVPTSHGPCRVYDAVTHSEQFIKDAQAALVENRVINGIDVTITPNNVDLNATDLIQRTTEEAKRVQKELFGR